MLFEVLGFSRRKILSPEFTSSTYECAGKDTLTDCSLPIEMMHPDSENVYRNFFDDRETDGDIARLSENSQRGPFAVFVACKLLIFKAAKIIGIGPLDFFGSLSR